MNNLGNLSLLETAKYGYDLSSRKITLNLGDSLLIQVNSNCNASISFFTIVQSTLEAVQTICFVFSGKFFWKYELSLERKFFAFPT